MTATWQGLGLGTVVHLLKPFTVAQLLRAVGAGAPGARVNQRAGGRPTFYPAGRAHSQTAAVGAAWERESWMAVQRAVWEALRPREGEA